jgi:hypothetical protein
MTPVNTDIDPTIFDIKLISVSIDSQRNIWIVDGDRITVSDNVYRTVLVWDFLLRIIPYNVHQESQK